MEKEQIEKAVEEVESQNNPEDRKITSTILPDGSIVEMVISDSGQAKFAVYKNGQVTYQNSIESNGKLTPWTSNNPLITSNTIKFPSRAEDYESNEKLLDEIVGYLKKYVELPEDFYIPVAIYVMTTWIYEKFSDVAYLRVIGISGTGKTRFIKTVGYISYKPMIASGSASTSALFRIIDLVGGTFVFDEADFQSTELWTDIVKILNSGHTKDLPVLRSQPTDKKGEFTPRPFRVFGPKILASRQRFKDEALESRCISEEMVLRQDIKSPIHLTNDFGREALSLRNKLLTFRFKNFDSLSIYEGEFVEKLDPRMRQTALSLLSTAKIVSDETSKAMFQFLKEYSERLTEERGYSEEADLLLVIAKLFFDERCNAEDDPHGIIKSKGIKVAEVAKAFNAHYRQEHDIKDSSNEDRFSKNNMTPKKAGEIARNSLKLKTKRQRFGFHIPLFEADKVSRLMDRYGFKVSDLKDVGCGTYHPKEVKKVDEVQKKVPFD